MWAELRPAGMGDYLGEVGLQYEASMLSTQPGKSVFSMLLRHTVPHQFSGDEIDQLCDLLAQKIDDVAALRSGRPSWRTCLI